MFITFEKIRFKNFLSFGNFFTEIDLNTSRKTLVLGKNGHGKSTILCALTYVLFGKPFRKINKPNIPNSINKKDCLVELEFSIHTKKYKIVRGMKPNIFEIYQNGILLNQDASIKDYQEHLEKNIIKTNYKSFTQVVILGSARYTPFMQLNASDRRSVVEDLLDIQIFSSMNVLVKDRINKVKDDILNLNHEIEVQKLKIASKVSVLKDYKNKTDKEVENKKAQIEEYTKNIDEYENKIKFLETEIQNCSNIVEENSTVEKKKKTLLSMEIKIDNSIKTIIKDVEFYSENDSCPVCKQHIEDSFKSQSIQNIEDRKKELEIGKVKLESQISKLEQKILEYQQIFKKINEYNIEISSMKASIASYKQFIDRLNSEIFNISDNDSDISSVSNDLKLLVSSCEEKVLEKEKLIDDKKYLEYCNNLLKDGGIKTKIVKQYLPLLNKLINEYLYKLDFFVNFNINENFEEVIKSRHRDEFQYNNFSEGEKLKIDISLLFAFRELSKIKNSVNCNLLLLDEIIDGALDENGINLFLDLITEMDYNTNIFVISHRSDQIKDRFDRSLTFEKVKNFSRFVVN